MDFYSKSISDTLKFLNSDEQNGLTSSVVEKNRNLYGANVITKKKKDRLIKRIFNALKEPMLLILIFSFIIAFGTGLGKFLKSGESDFAECLGVLFSIILSVSITLIMEGSSERAFLALNTIYQNATVKIIRNGQILSVRQSDVVCGDVVFLESGDKIIADGRLISTNGLTVDESALTGESLALNKDSNVILKNSTPLAERTNTVYSGTFVTGGSGKMVVTATGDLTEMGKIAGELKKKQDEDSPLQQKLAKLGKIISLIGSVCAVLVFAISVIRLSFNNSLTFSNLQELFVSCIILVVAAVPEGLPTIVAVSLALNMIKLAKENALIKKMIATETAGAVSVICSDKTGTITENKMKVVSVCLGGNCVIPDKGLSEVLKQNFILNSTADISIEGRNIKRQGSATECALIEAYIKSEKKSDYIAYRNEYQVVDRRPFSSETKYMTTTIRINGKNRTLIKGAPETVLNMCELSLVQKENIISSIKEEQKKARRVICFAHKDNEENIENAFIYDGFVSIFDPIRKEVYKAVNDCKRAGIKVKILTGDNAETAFAIAKELKLVSDSKQVITATDIEKISDQKLKEILPKITVIARSTPLIKLRVVKALKSLGEVVAVTGDGINDAPAIKHADVGIAMGQNGSEITKEASDVILLDDSFNTVVKAISFGRNVYRNLQRFIMFQLSVNLSALLFITVCAVLGLDSPFNTFQLLWINLIMDGPPAITLGLERAGSELMQLSPVKRKAGIVSVKMLLRIIFNGLFIGLVMILQHLYNFMNVPLTQTKSVTFSLFIIFQLFNAFNSRELGSESIFKNIGKNKVMTITFLGVFLIHLFIVQVLGGIFGISPMSISSWFKTVIMSSSIVMVSELAKLVIRLVKKEKRQTNNQVLGEKRLKFEKAYK